MAPLQYYYKYYNITIIMSTNNQMFINAIWDKVSECIFENFEVSRVKQEQFQNVRKSRRWFIPKLVRTNQKSTD